MFSPRKLGEDHIFQWVQPPTSDVRVSDFSFFGRRLKDWVDSAGFADIPKNRPIKGRLSHVIDNGKKCGSCAPGVTFLTAKGSGLYIDEGQTKDHEIKDNELSMI